MRLRKQVSTNRSFRWGVTPQFSRGLFVAPPMLPNAGAKAKGSRSGRRARRGPPSLLLGMVVSVVIHAGAVVMWRSASALDGDTDGLYARLAADPAEPLQVIRLPTVERELPQAEDAATSAEEQVTDNARPVLSPDRLEPSAYDVVASRPAMDLRLVDPSGTGVDARLISRVRQVAESGSSGTDGRDGQGDAAGSYVPPRARSMLHAWEPPEAVLGLEVMVRIHTDEHGKATGLVELLPPTGDHETDQELTYRVRNLEYWPAQLDGQPIAAWAEISYTFCYDGATAASPPSPTFGQPEPCARTNDALAITVGGPSRR